LSSIAIQDPTPEAIRLVKTWTTLPVMVVTDGAYNNKSLLDNCHVYATK